LNAAFGLIHMSMGFRLCVARSAPKTFFDFSAQIFGCAAQPILVHAILHFQLFGFSSRSR
jgi:hypothetical protein